jgi:3-hydroxyacyl-[acyl-carrier-protein] dehydratase
MVDKMLMNQDEIKDIIPHREPFLLIDEVTELEENKIKAVKYVKESEYYFEGHFPKEKVMPGVLIVESLAQAGAVAILSLKRFKGKIAYFGGIKNAKFRNKVVPGDVLELDVSLLRLGSRAGTAEAKAVISNRGMLACECELMFVIG